MNILLLTYPVNGLLMILMPVLLAVYLARKFGVSWRIWGIGCATFIFSQVGHIPFNYGLDYLFQFLPQFPEGVGLFLNSVILGLSAGLWEEIARYATYRWWARDARSWSKALMLGAGHGGIEAILLGLLVLLGFVNVVAATNMDLNAALPPEQAQLAQEQIQSYWSAPWYATLLGAVERFFALIIHLSLSVLVLQVFTRKQIRWLWLAVLWHALIDGIAVYTIVVWGPYETEAMVAGLALVSLAIILLLRPTHEEPLFRDSNNNWSSESYSETEDEKQLPGLPDLEETVENLDQTRYA